MSAGRPLRVLHVVGRMNPGGVETWLLDVFRHVDRSAVQSDLMVHHDADGAYDGEVRALGVRIFRNRPDNPIGYARRFLRIAAVPPRYDIVHSHVHHFSGAVLGLAALAKVPVRLAHSHNDTGIEDAAAGLPRQAYLHAMRWLLRQSATGGFACSHPAGQALFGGRWTCDARWRRLYCGIDPARFSGVAEREGVRTELGVPADARLLIHVGRFERQKNHAFLVEVFRRLASTVPSTYLVLVGTGTLQPGIETRLREAGLLDRARFCGRRSDVPRLLKASDAFVFPSLHEGLPLACLEAQAAGLPVVMSDRITRELVVFPERVASVSLASAEAWVDLVERALQSGSDAVGGGAALAGSPFSIANSTASLVAAYRDAHANGTQAASRPAAAMRTAAADSGALSTSGGTER